MKAPLDYISEIVGPDLQDGCNLSDDENDEQEKDNKDSETTNTGMINLIDNVDFKPMPIEFFEYHYLFRRIYTLWINVYFAVYFIRRLNYFTIVLRNNLKYLQTFINIYHFFD